MKNIMVVTGASCGPGVLAVVERVHAKLEQVAEDLETWKSTSVNTAYPVSIDH